MRIISGKYKARRLNPPKNLPVRPTTDKAKESLFNILSNSIDFEEICMLDLFAGTGSIGFEFASRGCNSITSVDQDFNCVKFIQKTIEELNILGMKAIKANAFSFISKTTNKYDLIFADPPYSLENLDSIPELVFNSNILKPGGTLIVEHSAINNFSSHPNFSETRTYSKVNFSFFEL